MRSQKEKTTHLVVEGALVLGEERHGNSIEEEEIEVWRER